MGEKFRNLEQTVFDRGLHHLQGEAEQVNCSPAVALVSKRLENRIAPDFALSQG
jgi:hypothetical protein